VVSCCIFSLFIRSSSAVAIVAVTLGSVAYVINFVVWLLHFYCGIYRTRLIADDDVFKISPILVAFIFVQPRCFANCCRCCLSLRMLFQPKIIVFRRFLFILYTTASLWSCRFSICHLSSSSISFFLEVQHRTHRCCRLLFLLLAFLG
jgi:hypothetical protein